MNIIKQLKWRYACKKFNPNKKLSDKKIKRLEKAFRLTATSFGLFPLKMLVITNQKIKESLVAHSYHQKQVVDCSHLLVICIDKTIDTKTIESHFELEKKIRKIEDASITDFRQNLIDSFSQKSNDDKEQGAKQQAYIALGNLLTVCAMEKIDACPMEGFLPDKYDELLGLKALNLKSSLILPVGYRADDDFMSQLKKVRKPLNEIIIKI